MQVNRREVLGTVLSSLGVAGVSGDVLEVPGCEPILLVKVKDGMLSEDAMKRIRETVRQHTGMKCIVAPEWLDIAVLTEASPRYFGKIQNGEHSVTVGVQTRDELEEFING